MGAMRWMLLLGLTAAGLLWTSHVWWPPQPIVEPVRVNASGVERVDVIVRWDHEIAVVNIVAPRRCYTVTLRDAQNQATTFVAQSECGRVLWLPIAGR